MSQTTKRTWAIVFALLAAAACHPKKPVNPDSLIGKGAERVDPKLLPNRFPVDPKYPPNPPSFLLAKVPEKSVGPFLTRHADTTMAAYVGPGDGASRRVISLPIGADGTPFDPEDVAPASEDATMLVVRPAGGAEGAYVFAWTDLTDKGEALSVVGVTALGKPRSAPIELGRTQDDIVWIEMLPTPSGEVAVWVEDSRSAGANLFAVALDPAGRPRGVPSVIVRGIVGWQAVPTASGAGIAILTRKPGGPVAAKEGAKGSETTLVSWIVLDADARPAGAPVVIAESPQRIVDVDVAAVGPDFVFSWTKRGAPEPEVMVALVDASGKVTPPHSISARSGGASLIDAASGAHGGVLAWEETSHLARASRRLHLVPLEVGKLPQSPSPGEPAGGVLAVDIAGSPEVAPLDHGYAVLARLRTCADPPIEGVPCDDPAPAPTFVRLDAELKVVETQPILIDQTQAHATLAWNLSCQKDSCFVLAAGTENPAIVRLVKLSPSPNRWRSPSPPPPPADAPRVLAVDTLASSDLYSELAVAPVKGTPMLAAITTESVIKGEALLAATVSVTPLDASGSARAPAVVLTRHARPEGGVSVSEAEGRDGGAVAWVGRENGHAAVHVTRIDGNGKRTNDIQLTTANGDASDVALAWVGGGWVVVWVDTRDGNGEVYATKLDPDLHRVAREVRITNAPGDASDVAVRAEPGKDGPIVWVTWADPRESPKEGVADIYVTRLKGLDATPLGPEERVLATVPHSRSPALAAPAGNEGVSIAWIEEAPSGADPAGASVYGALIGTLDEKGHLVGEPVRTRGAGEGFPTSIAMERVNGQLHVALTRSTRDDIFLDAMTFPSRPYPLFGLEGPPSMDVALTIMGDGVYFNDQTEGAAEGRVRRATIEWKR